MLLNNINQKALIDFKWIKIMHQKKSCRKNIIDRANKYVNGNQACRRELNKLARHCLCILSWLKKICICSTRQHLISKSFTMLLTAYKESVFGVVLVRIFPGFSRIRGIFPYSVRMRENSGKMRTRITLNTD